MSAQGNHHSLLRGQTGLGTSGMGLGLSMNAFIPVDVSSLSVGGGVGGEAMQKDFQEGSEIPESQNH